MSKIVEQIILKVMLQDTASKSLKGIGDSAKNAKKSTDAMTDSVKREMPKVSKSLKKGSKNAKLFNKALKLVAAVGIAIGDLYQDAKRPDLGRRAADRAGLFGKA